MLSRLARWIGYATVMFAVVSVVALLAGFVRFAGRVASEEIILDRPADGIVVLTGAASRIPDAIELLSSGKGRRLLITGVNWSTRAEEIARLTPLHERVFACCVDLDRSALNTLGNAIETRRWARERGFQSLIIVTSNWHMPRAMTEVEHQLPDLRLVPFPVVANKIKGEPWWSDSVTLRLVVSEYFKYVFAVTRMQFDPEYPG